jgi:dihydroorotate dehydrogenase
VRYFRTIHNKDVDFYRSVIRPLAFRFDPEWVHGQAGRFIDSGLLGGTFRDPRLEQTLFGVKFENPIGLAAGFDKNADHLAAWPKYGFGHVEIGTVTDRPQPGNDRPRMFRLPEDRALINRMGFNNDGADVVATRLSSTKRSYPLGINLGKNKDVEAAGAAENYLNAFRKLQGRGDYYVINVSSPNTPGLRSLQEKGPLAEILSALRTADPVVPIFIKVAPDLELTALDDVIDVAISGGAVGLIATNTTISRDGLTRDPGQTGGLSGAPVREKSNVVLKHLAKSAPQLVLIGVGGIFTAEDVLQKIRLGASLTQLYTGWIYGGPGSIPRILGDLATQLDHDGVKSISDYHRADL